MSKREPTEQELKDYKYMVDLSINVTRTDNKMLTDSENSMVMDMKKSAEDALTKVMVDYGNSNRKHLGSDVRIY